jgi:purine-binding chemotaxis protein CheW
MEHEKSSTIQEVQAVVFLLNNSYYGVPILQVQEIVKMTEITKLPETPDFVEGVVNLRGQIVPILDLRKRFSLPKVAVNENWRILILKAEGIHFGVMVDQISQVEKVPASLIEVPPKVVSGVKGDFIRGIAKMKDRLLILLDIEKILSHREIEALQEIEN